jgi:hypothetical protein
MEQSLKDRFARNIRKAIESGLKHTQDPILLAETVTDSVELMYDILHEPEGIASLPTGFQSPALDLAPPPPPKGTLAHKDIATDPGEAKRVILMPGDPGFEEKTPPEVERKVFSSGAQIRRRTGGVARRPSNLIETPKWEVSDLLALVNENSPEYIDFEPQGMEGAMTLRAHKNIKTQAGLGIVQLTYRHAAVSDDSPGGVFAGQAASLGLLTAVVPFSVYNENQDINEALDGPKGIKVQLKGMYKARPEKLEPMESGSSPQLTSRNSPMGDSLSRNEGAMVPGMEPTSNPYADKASDSILREHLLRLANQNASLVPLGRELKDR